MGNSTSFGNTPQAKDDLFFLTEDAPITVGGYIAYFDVMMNDLGGASKSLFSIDNSVTNTPTTIIQGDLLIQDTARAEATSTDTSLNGAKIWITADGKVGYDAGTLTSAFLTSLQALNSGAVINDTFTYSIRMGNGTLSWATATVQYSGANDPPTLAVIAPASITEIANSSSVSTAGLTGAFVGSDVDDATSSLRYSVDGATDNGDGTVSKVGAYGTLTVNKVTGAYNFVQNAAAIEALNIGQSVADNFNIKVTDPHGASSAVQVFKVNVTGGNDGPTLDAVAGGFVSEVNQSSSVTSGGLTGTLVGHDVDAGDTQTYGIQGVTAAGGFATLAATYGTLKVNIATGQYTYTPNGAVEGLDAGETANDVFTVTVTDSHGASTTRTYTIAQTGADDAPTLASVTAGSITETDQSSSTTFAGLAGTLVGADVDVETLAYGITGGVVAAGVATLVGVYGTLTVNTSSGAYVYTPNAAAIEGLDAGEHPTDSFTVTVSDGDGPLVTQAYTVTLNGADDAPTLAAVTAGSVSEDDQLSTTTTSGLTGTLAGADVDGEALTYGLVGSVPAGPGEVSVTTAYGVLTLTTATGAYSFAANAAAIEGLDVGETPALNFTFTVTDGDGPLVTQAYTVTLNGADDAPTLAAVTAGSVTEITQSSATTPVGLTGTLAGADVDGDTLAYGVLGGVEAAGVSTLVGTYGTLTVNTTSGAYTYAPNSAAIEALDAGEHPVDSFTVTVSDGDGPVVTQAYTVTLNGADDAPTLAAVTSGSVTETDQSSSTTFAGLTGTLAGADVDGEALTYGLVGSVPAGPGEVSVTTAYGVLTLTTATGAYSFAANAAAIEGLDVGETPALNFTFTVTDGDDALVTTPYTINLTGADDAPTLQAVVASIAENPLATSTTTSNLSGLLVGADVDVETLTYGLQGGVPAGPGQVSVTTTYGVLTVTTASGAYVFTPNSAAIEALPVGAAPQVVVNTTVTDGDDSPVVSTFTLNLTGANDAPTAEADTGFSTNEDVPLVISAAALLGNDHDPDAGDILVVSGVSNPVGGAVSFDGGTGQITFTPATNYSGPASFTYAIADGHGGVSSASVSLTVTAVADAPVLTVAPASGDEDTAIPLTISSALTDTDGSESLAIVISGVPTGATLSSGIDNGGGVWTLTPAQLTDLTITPPANADADFVLTVTATATEASNASAASTVHTIAVTVTAVADAPTLTVADVTGNEDTAIPLTISSALTDTDGSESLAITISGVPTGATLSAGINNGGGSWSLTPVQLTGLTITPPANSNADFTLTVTATSTEANGGDTEATVATVNVTVDAVNDAPDAAAATASLTVDEDTPVAVTGLSVSDIDSGAASVSATLAADHGVISVAAAPGVVIAGNASGLVTLSGTMAAINAALAAVTYQGLLNYNGPDTVTLSVDDLGATGSGGALSDSASVAITVTSVNDAPTLAAPGDGSVAEIDQSSLVNAAGLSGILGGADVDGDTLTYGVVGGTVASGVSTLVLAHGTLSVDVATGAYTYTPNSAAVEALDDGETPSDAFTVTVTDGIAPPVSQTYTVNFTGADDAPTLAAVTSGAIAEVDQAQTTTSSSLSGTLAGADVDVETLTYGVTGGVVAAGFSTLNTAYGSLSVNTATGAYVFTPNAAAIEGLDVGETPALNFTMTVTDGDDALVTQNYAINLTGADDGPTLAAVTAGSVTEITQSAATTPVGLTGTLAGADVDGDTLAYGVLGGAEAAGVSTLVGTYGTLTVNTTSGAYTYAPNAAAIEALDDGDQPVDSFTVTVFDGDGPLVTQAYTVTLNGADDAPTLAAVTSGSVTEITQSSSTTPVGLTGTLAGSDVDGDTLAYGVLGGAEAAGVSTLVGTYGTLTVNTTSGAYTYAPNAAAIEALDAGEHPVDSFTVTVSDGDGPAVTQAYTVTLNGADDAPTLAAVTSGSVTEITQSSSTTPVGLTGTLAGADVDGDTLVYGVLGGAEAAGVSTLVGTYGTLTVNTSTGQYTYTQNAAAIEALDDSESDSDVFTVTVSDGDGPAVTQTYTVNVFGADDAPTLAAVTAGSVTEITQSASTTPVGLTGTLAGADVDGDPLAYGVLGGVEAAGVSTLVGTYGTLTVNTSTGQYTYTQNAAAIEALDDSESDSDVFTVTVSDGDGPAVTQTYTVNVFGADDAPTLAAVTSGSVTEITQSASTTPVGLTGTLAGADVDGETLAYGITGGAEAAGVSTLVGTYGTLTVNTSTGQYTYTQNAAAIEALDDSESDSDVFTVTVSDGDGPAVTQTYTVNVFGADDAPTLAAVTSGSVSEIDQLSTTTTSGLTGTLAGADVDGETLTYGLVGSVPAGPGEVSVTTAYGVLTLTTATGAYSFAANAAAIEGLDVGENPALNFTFTVTDGDDALVTTPYTINLTGADDAPTLAAVSAGSVTEDDQASTRTTANLAGTLIGSDVDGETLTYGVDGGTVVATTSTLVGAYGTLTVDTATGAYAYTANAAAVEALDASETAQDVFTLTVSDGDAPLGTTTYTVNIAGADDAPVLSAVTSGAIAEVDQSSGTTASGLSGTLAATDVDVETLTYGVNGGTVAAGFSTVTTAYGTLSVNISSGAYVFTPNAAAIEGLDVGENPVVNFTMTVTDGDGDLVTQNYAINLTGADDGPTLAAVTNGAIAEVDQSSTTTSSGLSGTLAGADVDVETLTYGLTGGVVAAGFSTLTNAYGTLSVNTATGAYDFTPNAAAIEGLDVGENPVVNFTMTVTDGDGPLVTQNYAINLTGADDGPTLAAVTNGAIAEVDQSSTITSSGLSGTLAGADVDGETLTYGVTGGTVAAGFSTLTTAYGTLSVNTATGAYDFTPLAGAIEGLDVGETPALNFTFTVTDGDGPAVTTGYTINLTGADDAPVLSAVTSGAIAEVDQSSTTTSSGLSGTLAGADVDVETLTYGVSGGVVAAGFSTLTNAYGTLSVNTASGAYVFTPNAAAIEGLDVGENPALNFTFTVTDGDGPLGTTNYTINLTGADDGPTLAAVTNGAIAEVDQSSTTTSSGLSGTLAGADVDVETLTYGLTGGTVAAGFSTLNTAYGTLSVNTASGAYVFTPNAAAIEGLDVGENPALNFTFTVTDGDGPAVTTAYSINLTGADDAPTLAAVTNGAITEVDQSSTTTSSGLSGTLVGADVDVETLTYGLQGGTVAAGVSTVTTAYGSLAVNVTTGAYVFTPNAGAIEGLDATEVQTLNFTFTVSDGSAPAGTTAYSITVTGADDAPVLGNVANGSITETAQSAATTVSGLSGTLVGTDVDTETLTYGVQGGTVAAGVSTLVGTFGTLTVNTTTGAYTYAANGPAVEGLDTGETGQDVFTMTVSDGDAPLGTKTYTVNVIGSDDAPTLAAVTNGAIAEITQSSSVTSSGLSGTLAGADVDGEALTYGINGGTVAAGVSTLVNTYGTLAVNTTSGAWTFTPNAAAIEGLDVGETQNPTFTFTVSDGDGALVTTNYTVNITGADDTPTLAAVTSGSIAEVDQSATRTASGLTGTLAGSDVDSEALTYGVQGGAVAAGTSTLVGTYGTLVVTVATGAYTYTQNAAAIEGLDATETGQDVFTVTVNDGDAPLGTTTYTVNVTGADDTPTLAAVVNGTVTEVANSATETLANLSGTLAGSDVDSETLTYGVQGASVAAGVATLVGTYGTLTVNTTTGAYAYTPNTAAVEALGTGQQGVDNFTFTVSDGDAPLGTRAWTVTATGANDAPVLNANGGSLTYTENQAAAAIDTVLTASDIDSANLTSATVSITGNFVSGQDVLGFTNQNGITGSYNAATGVLTLSGSSSVANYQTALQSVTYANSSENPSGATRTISYQANDGSAASNTVTATVSVGAVNDAPVNTVPGTQTSTVAPVVFNSISVSDVDAGANAEQVTISVAHGTLTLSTASGLVFSAGDGTADTTMTFLGTLASINAALNGLTYTRTGGFIGTDTLTITSSDLGNTGSGGALTDTDTVTINDNASPNPTTLTTGVDTIQFGIGSNTVTAAGGGDGNGLGGTSATLNNGDTIVGGGGTDTLNLTVTGTTNESPYIFTFGDGVGDIGLSNFETLTVAGSGVNNGHKIDVSLIFGSDFSNPGTLTINASSLAAGSNVNSFKFNASAVTTGNFVVTGSSSVSNTLVGGALGDVLTGGSAADVLIGKGGGDSLTGGTGADQFRLSTNGGTDNITDYLDNTDKIGFLEGAGTGAVNFVTTGTAGGATLGAADFTSRTSIATINATDDNHVDVISAAQTAAQITASTGIAATNLYVFVFNSTTAKGEIWFDTDWSDTANRVQVATLSNITTLGGITAITASDIVVYDSTLGPAGVAGSPINLGLTDPAPGHIGPVSLTISGVAAGWTLSEGVDNGNGSWTILADDVSSLTVTTPGAFAGAMALQVQATWTNPDGTSGFVELTDNVEAFAPGNPIFALSDVDYLTGSSGADLFVFSRPISADTIFNFDAAADSIDLIGFDGFASFADIQANLTENAAGEAVITLSSGETITLDGVHAAVLTAANFMFDQVPTVTNPGAMTIGDGAMLPLTGAINNTGSIALNSSGHETDLEVLANGATLTGGGQVTLSDSAQNVIYGATDAVTLTNVDNTIAGAGQIGLGQLVLINGGTINASGVNALVIDTGANVITNSGLLEATGAGGLTVNSAIVNTGALVSDGGDLHLMGDVSGSGTASIFGSGLIEFGGAASANVTFAADAAGMLVLDHSDSFTGVVSGFNGDDGLDLNDILFAGATVGYVENADHTGGVLTVSDGVHSSSIVLLGVFDAAGFMIGDDHHGGSLLGYTPPGYGF